MAGKRPVRHETAARHFRGICSEVKCPNGRLVPASGRTEKRVCRSEQVSERAGHSQASHRHQEQAGGNDDQGGGPAETGIRSIVRAAVESLGYSALEASTAAHALELARTERPALIVLDLALPDGDGLSFCREVRRWSSVR